MFHIYAKPFGRFMAIGVTVVSQIIGYPWLSFGIREKRIVRLKITLRDTEEEADKVCSNVQRTFDNAVGKLPAVSHFNTKTNLSALNYAQDFGTFFWTFKVGYSHESRIVLCLTL